MLVGPSSKGRLLSAIETPSADEAFLFRSSLAAARLLSDKGRSGDRGSPALLGRKILRIKPRSPEDFDWNRRSPDSVLWILDSRVRQPASSLSRHAARTLSGESTPLAFFTGANSSSRSVSTIATRLAMGIESKMNISNFTAFGDFGADELAVVVDVRIGFVCDVEGERLSDTLEKRSIEHVNRNAAGPSISGRRRGALDGKFVWKIAVFDDGRLAVVIDDESNFSFGSTLRTTFAENSEPPWR